jgi:hypothetical protein
MAFSEVYSLKNRRRRQGLMMATDHQPPGWLPKWPWWVWLLAALFPIPLKPWWLTIISLSLFGLLAWLLNGQSKIGKSMTHDEILRSILLPLADEFEAGNTRAKTIDPASTEEYEPLRKCLATLMAEGSLTEFLIESQKTGMYQLTNEGYRKYKPRIDALQAPSSALGKS